MDEEETELNNLNRSNKNNNDNIDNRPSWNSSASENSYTQNTLYSQNPFNDNGIKSNKDDRNNDVAVNMKPGTTVPRRYSFAPLPSNQSNEHLTKGGENKASVSLTPSSPTLPSSSPQNGNETAATNKPNPFTRFMSSFPDFVQMRKSVKASLALLIAVIFILDSQTRAVTGESVLLVAIVVIFYFPVRTIGKRERKLCSSRKKSIFYFTKALHFYFYFSAGIQTEVRQN